MDEDEEPDKVGDEESDDDKGRRERRWRLLVETLAKVTALIIAITALIGACNGNGPS